jgi:outer membrane protein
MKKLQVLAVVMVLLIAGNNASAQTKIAYIRIDDIVSLMPDLQKIDMDTVGTQFLKDSVQPRVEYLNNEYQRKLQDYLDTLKNSKAVREQLGKDLEEIRNELSGVQSYVQQVQQFKQQEFLRPYYKKAKDAIDAVAKRKGYTHVLSSDIFLLAPEPDDISMAVLTELKIELPKQNTPGNQPKANPGTGGTKPPVKNN